MLLKRVYLFDEKSVLACFGNIMDHLILVHILYLQDSVPRLNGQPHFVRCSRNGEGTILISGMLTLLTLGGDEDARSAQAKREFIITSVRLDGVIQSL